MPNPLSTSIAARSAAIMLVIVALVGAAFFALAYVLAEQQEESDRRAHLVELLDTVERSASLACFLSDTTMADEIARGLLMNRMVQAVTITAGSKLLAQRGDPLLDEQGDFRSADALVRSLKSPSNAAEVLGEIVLVPNLREIRSDVIHEAWTTGRLLLLQVVFTAFGVVLVVLSLITRPIAAISSRLHEMRKEAGQKLEVPDGHDADEIGQLVRDVNQLLDYLGNILTEERHLHTQLGVEERKFRAIFEHANTGIFLLDGSHRLVSCNRACRKFLDLNQDGAEGSLFIDLVGESWKTAPAMLARAAVDREAVDEDVKSPARPGVPARWLNIFLTPVEDGHLQGVVNDITEIKRSEVAAHELAVTDPLTGLSNRLGFERRLENMIDACHAGALHGFTLLMIDLDWFKQINDTHGHQAGDAVLACVAGSLEGAVRKSDFVARLGGDEFVVLLDVTNQRETVETIVRKVIAAVGRPIPIPAGVSVTIGASVGAALFERGMTREQLLGGADEAMYAAKAKGRNAFHFADSEAA